MLSLVENLFLQKNPLQNWLSSLNAVISTNESTEFITGHVIYNLAYTYKFQVKTTMIYFSAVFSIWKGINFHFFSLYLCFLHTLGPALPKVLYGHSIIEIQGDVFLFGGSGAAYNSAIYQLSCSSGICSWATLDQELTVGRRYTVAISVPYSFCT